MCLDTFFYSLNISLRCGVESELEGRREETGDWMGTEVGDGGGGTYTRVAG